MTTSEDPYIKNLYRVAFEGIKRQLPQQSTRILEVGSGSVLSREYVPTAMFTDVEFQIGLDAVLRSEQLPIRTSSLDAILLKDSFHHIPDIEAFLDEAFRALRPLGRVIVFDPYWGALARFVYRFLHQERFDTRTADWTFRSTSAWDSNQALSYILLRRDRDKFTKRFPGFSITETGPLIGPSFLLSGGVSRRTRISGRLLTRLLTWELKQSQWFDHFRFFHVFVLTKNTSGVSR